MQRTKKKEKKERNLFSSDATSDVLRLFGGKIHGFHDNTGARRGAGAEVEVEGGKERAPGLHVVADHGRILSTARHPKVCLVREERVRFSR